MNMTLKLGKTYFDKGFFNVKMELVQTYFKKNSGVCVFVINEHFFKCNYKQANHYGQIRIFGKEKLKNFFKENHKINDFIEIKFIEL